MATHPSILESLPFCCCGRRKNGRQQNLWETVRLYSDDEEEYVVPGFIFSQPQPQTAVRLDLASAGQYAVIVKNNTRLCGSGAARTNAPIVQDKVYFEVKIQSDGVWAIGLCLKQATLNSTNELRTQPTAWVLFNDGKIYHNSSTSPIAYLQGRIEEGDTIGVFYDHTELRFATNGALQLVHLPDSNTTQAGLTCVRGTVYPVVAVDSGAIIDTRFSSFQHPPKNGFTEIQFEQTIL